MLEAYCFTCGTVLARSTNRVPLKDKAIWFAQTRAKIEGCSKCQVRNGDPRFVVMVRAV